MSPAARPAEGAPPWACPCCGVLNAVTLPGCRTCRAAQPGLLGVGPRDEELSLRAAPARRSLGSAALVLLLGVAGAAWLDRLPSQHHRRGLGGASEAHRLGELHQGAQGMREALRPIAAGEALPAGALRALQERARLAEGPSGAPSLAPAEQQLRRILADIAALQAVFTELSRAERARRAHALDAELAALQGALDRAHPSP